MLFREKNTEKEFVHGLTVGDKDNQFDIYYDGDDLCFNLLNYKSNNAFYILRDNAMYMPMREMFKKIKAYDKFRYVSSNDNSTKFEWVSDGKLNEVPNRLVMIETMDGYRIEFVKGNTDKKNCLVKFSLENSRDQAITNIVDEMVVNAISVDKAISK